MVRIHFIIEMIWWTSHAPWELEFPFPGSLTSTLLYNPRPTDSHKRLARHPRRALMVETPCIA